MNEPRIFITSMGIISPIGQDICDTIDAIKKTTRGIKPLSLFPTGLMPSLPVGEVRFSSFTENIPRTHALAIAAAREAMKTSESAPDAIVIGTTTGGMPFTEELIKRGDIDPKQYGCHSTASVAEHIARHAGCRGPVLTVSTACSSGAVAVKIAVEMLRNGKVKQVLAGGADALCRLTYYGFHALQLVDEKEAHPFDRNRRGMSVGEGAAMFLLTAAESPPDNAIAELLGAGLSCDAYHPSTPHPDGKGAFCAMKAAISDAGISPSDIDYIHLHGTGTVDNDLSEARAIQILFGDGSVPPVSSLKGAVGHALAAAGAMGVVVSALSIAHSLMPANVGFHDHDPALGITPVEAPITANVTMALANSFGFGGNNAAVVVGRPRKQKGARTPIRDVRPVAFTVLGSACVTGAGNTEESIANMGNGGKIKGVVPGW